MYRLLADGVLVIHSLFIVFIVGGLLLIVLGGWRGWHWVRNRWFRRAHLAGIGVVVLQAWLGMICPVTTLEMRLRELAGQATYDESFIQYWLHRLIYYQAPLWVFGLLYTLFALLVLFAWLRYPPE